MRAMYYSYVIILLTVSCTLENELNTLHMASKGYPLIPFYESGYMANVTTEEQLNSTIIGYGLDRIPANSGSNSYLGTGGMLLTTYNLFSDFFVYSTLGFSSFIQNNFPSMPVTLKMGISAAITLNNFIAIISFIRGVSLRWL